MRDLNELSSNLFYTTDVSMPEPIEVEDELSGDITLVSLDYNTMEYYIDVKVNCEHPLKKSLFEGVVGYNIPMTISLPENWTHNDSEYSIDFSIRGTSKDKIVRTVPLPYKVNSGKLKVIFDLELIRKFDNPEIQIEVTQKWDNKKILYSFDFSSLTMAPEGSSSSEDEATSWNQVTVSNIKNNYLFGIDLSDANGNPLPPDLFVHYINASVDYLQNLLDIVITPTEFTERHDYVRSDYMNWGFIQLDHNPVRTVKRLSLMYGNERSVDIPSDWIQLDKLTGQITLFPASGSANSLIIGQTGTLFGFQGWNYAPMMWEVEYEAGIDENDKTVPVSLLKEAVSKRASCGILNVWGDLIIGAGIANQSVSIDGISQSIGTTQSAMFGGASARVTEYTKDLNENILPVLRQKFGGIRMVVV